MLSLKAQLVLKSWRVYLCSVCRWKREEFCKRDIHKYETYASLIEVDGAMLSLRPDEWREVKLDRVFTDDIMHTQSSWSIVLKKKNVTI